MSPSILDELIGDLRRTHLGRSEDDAAYELVYRLGLMGFRDVTADDPRVRLAAQAVVTGVPF